MPSGETEPDDVSERVARGFEALVSEESAVHGGGDAVPASAMGEAPPPPSDAPMSIAATRLVALEGRVRQTMDRLTELVEAQLPETVDGLRADLETLRLELQTSLAQAGELMAEERQQLRAQIATTVGAANRWFVRARDQIQERLDHIAEVASKAQEQAERAATAVSAGAAASTGAGPGRKAARWPDDAEGDEGEEGSREGTAAGAGAGAGADGEGLEWEIEDDFDEERPPARRAKTVELALEAPELEALLDPVRGDMQELQLEVSSMGEAVTQLAGELAKLAGRMPARPRGVKLAPDQVELIVEAVMAAMPAPVRPAPPKRTVPKKAVSGKAAPAAPSKKAPGSAKRGAILN